MTPGQPIKLRKMHAILKQIEKKVLSAAIRKLN